MEELIKYQGILAMELSNNYYPVLHNPKAIANLQYLDGKFCAGKLKPAVESAIIVLLEMELRMN